jgi:hypothetical protein
MVKESLLLGLEKLQKSLTPHKGNKRKLIAFLKKMQDQRFLLKGVKGVELRKAFDEIGKIITDKEHNLLSLIEHNVFGADERRRNFPE